MTETMAIYNSGVQELIEKQKAEIKKFIAPTLTEGEFWTFIQTAKALDLNPLKREIYPVKYPSGDAGRLQIITGYEVYIKRANLSKLLEWWKVTIEKPSEDFKTWIGVFTAKRIDWTQEFTWEVPMVECFKSSEKATPWTTMKEFMLKKTTIGQGMRLLIPEVLAGMPYIAEEIGSQIIESDYTEITEDQKIEPSEAEQQAKDDAKRASLEKIKNAVDDCLTVQMLDERYKKNEKKYDNSELKDEIIAIYNERKLILTEIDSIKIINKLVELTGHKYPDIQAYVNPEILSSPLVAAVMNNEPDAIAQFTAQVVEFLNGVNNESLEENSENEKNTLV